MEEDATHVAPASGRNAHRRLRTGILAALIAGTLLLIAQSVYTVATGWPFRPFVSAAGGLAGVLEQQSGQSVRLAMFVGLAARDVAGGEVGRLVAPKAVTSLGDGQIVEGETVRMRVHNLRQASGGTLTYEYYDPVLDDDAIAALRKRPGVRFVQHPMMVYGVVGPDPSPEVLLFTDERHEAIYALPSALARQVMAP